jgi:radical SAM-linked protein
MSERYRLRWTKEGRTRYVSARDQSSIWERAIRRADLPIAYSEGFTPHARVSFPDALSVGIASTGEYAELTFAAPIRADHDLARLSAALPEGMDVLTYTDVPAGAPKLASLLRATLWELVWPPVDATALTTLLGRRCEELLAASTYEIVRHRHDGERRLDVRPAVVSLAVAKSPAPDGAGARTVLRAVLRNDAPIIRPADLLAALSGDDVAPPALVRRVAQGAPVDAGLVEALAGGFEPVDPNVVAEAA